MEISILSLLLGFAVWAVLFMRIAGVWGCCLAVLIVGTLFGHPFFHVSAVTLDRVLLLGTFGLYGLHRWFGLAEPKRWGCGDWALVGLLITLIVSTFSHYVTSGGTASIARLLFFILLPAAGYMLARDTQVTPSRLRWMFGTFALLGIYLSITAIAERFEFNWAVFPRYIADPRYEEFLGRARGPLLNPSANGVLLTLGLSCLLMFYSVGDRLNKLLVSIFIPLFLAGLYCTLTRCVWLGGGLALIVIVWCTMPKRFRIPSIATVTILAVVIVGVNWERLVAFKRDKNVSTADMQQSASLRPILAVVAWKIFLDYPILGCGYGRYLEVAPDYLQDRDFDLPLEKARPYVQHNILLSMLTETGLLGMILFGGLLIHWSRLAWQLWNRRDGPLETRELGLVFLGTMSGYLANGMFQDVTIMPMMNAFLFFLAGTLQSLVAVAQPREKSFGYLVGHPKTLNLARDM